MKPLSLFLLAMFSLVSACNPVTITNPPPTSTQAPLVLYTDIVSGPNSGGENNKGIYLSIFGKNFGSGTLGSNIKVLIGGVEVDNYRYLGASKGRADIQQITVQIGALGNPTPGVNLPVKVLVDGLASNTDSSFIVNPGGILFVDNVSGNDATAVIGDISKPFRYVQTPALYTGGAWEKVQPGDFIVMRGKGTAWTDVGFEHYFMRYRDKSGSAATGAPGTGAIAIMGYPTEDVFIQGTIKAGMTGGCITAINGQSFPGKGQWAAISNLRIDCEGYDGPISQQVEGNNWRVINNDLSASTAPRTGSSVPKMAGIVGNGYGSVWLGNHIHDIQGSSQECHGIYIDGNGTYEIAYNWIQNIRDGNGFQIYVNGGNGSSNADDISFHHNLIHDVSKHGINLADGTRNNIQIYNNIVYNTQVAGVRFNTTDIKDAKIYNNTFYNTVKGGNSSYGILMNDWNLSPGAVDIRNNIFWTKTGTAYNAGSNGFNSSVGTIKNNLWFGSTDAPSLDATPIIGDPKFVVTGVNFHLEASSPAVNQGDNAAATLVKNDFDISMSRDSSIDVGALER